MFPPVRSLSPNERKALMESFLPTDDFSFFGWMRQLGLAAPLDGSSVKLRMMNGDDTSTTASSLPWWFCTFEAKAFPGHL